MSKILKTVISLMLVVSLLMVGCSNTDTQNDVSSNNDSTNQNSDVNEEKIEYPSSIVIASGPIGGPWYSSMTKVSEILMREFPGLTVSVIEGGAEGNLQLLNEGVDAQLAMTSSVAMQQSKDGSGTLEKLDNVTAVMPIVSSYIQTAVPANSDIKGFEDLVGKNVSAGKTGFASELVFREILNAYGITYDDIKSAGGSVDLLNWSEYPTLVADGHLDAISLNGEVPHNIFMQIEVDKPLRLLKVGEEQLKTVQEKLPALFTKTFAAGETYEGTTEEVTLFGYSGILAASKDLSDEFLIKVMELIQENKDEIVSELQFVDLLGWENVDSGMSEMVCRPAIWEKIQEESK